MYTEEIEVLLSDIQDLEKQRIKWNGKESKVIGFLVVDQDVEPLIKGEHVPGDLPPVEKVERGFLALGQTIASEEDCLQNDDRACSIGLDLAHAFPRTVAGEQSAVVKRTKHHDDLRLLSVNHVVWMNGWAQPPCKIVSKPFSNPPFTRVGTVSVPEENIPLKGCCHVNTFEELALAEVAADVCPDAPRRMPIQCHSGPIYRRDCCGEARQACVINTDFRLAQRFEYGRFLFRDQILIQDKSEKEEPDQCGNPTKIPFAARGNSGALLFQKETEDGPYVPVAVLWAGSPEIGLYVAVPLLPYFEHRHLAFVHYEVPKAPKE